MHETATKHEQEHCQPKGHRAPAPASWRRAQRARGRCRRFELPAGARGESSSKQATWRGELARRMGEVSFTDEADGLVSCTPSSSTADKAVFAAFRQHIGVTSSGDGLAADAKLLFKVTIDSNEKKGSKPVYFFVGVPQASPFSAALGLCNRTFYSTKTDQTAEHNQGAFLLQGGYGINPNKSAGNVFMAYGNELVFHTKVDFTRLAFAA